MVTLPQNVAILDDIPVSVPENPFFHHVYGVHHHDFTILVGKCPICEPFLVGR